MRRVRRPAIPPILVVAALFSGATAGDVASVDPARPIDSRAEVVVLGARTLFETNADALRSSGAEALERLATDRLSRHVAAGSVVAIRVVGHSDGVGRAAYNLQLSRRRAAAVADVLARLYPDVPMTVEGRGESAPVADDASAAGRARNRRVEIHVVSVDERR